jgi:hypothetical protein
MIYQKIRKLLGNQVIPYVDNNSEKMSKLIATQSLRIDLIEKNNDQKLSNRLENNYHLSNKKMLF